MTTIEAKFSTIYRAAHVTLPDQAADVISRAEVVGDAIAPAAAEAREAGAHGLANNLTALGEELFVRLSALARTLNDSAIGLDRLAADVARTDDEARAWFSSHPGWLTDHPGFGLGPDVATPPRLPDGRTIDPDLQRELNEWAEQNEDALGGLPDYSGVSEPDSSPIPSPIPSPTPSPIPRRPRHERP